MLKKRSNPVAVNLVKTEIVKNYETHAKYYDNPAVTGELTRETV